jgi:hypothetical protein
MKCHLVREIAVKFLPMDQVRQLAEELEQGVHALS